MPRDQDGNEIFTRSAYAFVKQHTVFQGKRNVVPAGTHAIFDVVLTDQIYLQGGRYWVKGAADGDYVEFAIVDKDDVLGLFAYYGLTVGVDVLELSKYVRTAFVPAVELFQDELRVEAAAKVVAGLYARSIYHSVGTTDPTFGVTFLWYEE